VGRGYLGLRLPVPLKVAPGGAAGTVTVTVTGTV
jgi:hypothetical protein